MFFIAESLSFLVWHYLREKFLFASVSLTTVSEFQVAFEEVSAIEEVMAEEDSETVTAAGSEAVGEDVDEVVVEAAEGVEVGVEDEVTMYSFCFFKRLILPFQLLIT